MNSEISAAPRAYTFQPGQAPLVFEAGGNGGDMIQWSVSNIEMIRKALLKTGAVLLRGFRLGSPQKFEDLIRKTMGPPIHYTYASTPRTKVMSNIYTSTEYPAHRSIPLHNEMAYTRHWPKHLFFYCHTPAASGGQTPIADSRRVYKAIPKSIREAFTRHGLRYVRNYDGYLDLSWQKAFGAQTKEEVETRCQQMGIQMEWVTPNHLRTSENCPAVVEHPVTGDSVWFNQAHLFHISGMEPDIRELLMDSGEENLPRNVYFGNGDPIPDDMLDDVRQILDEEQIIFDWRQSDVLLVDNLLMAHGRTPFEGARKILVGMTA